MLNNQERKYALIVPMTYHPDVPAPLVVALHGGGGNAKAMCSLKGGIQELAEEGAFIVLCPEGLENHWNDGRGIDNWRAHEEGIDDVGFILALIDHLSDEYAIDPNRIFVTGISNGGKMSFRLACEATNMFRAAAPLIASQPAELDCRPSEPISLLIMNGTDDPLVPWDGGLVRFYRQELGEVLSTADTVAFWVNHNSCDPDPESEWLPDRDTKDGTRIVKDWYDNCADSSEVILYTVIGGGHTWPGGSQYIPAMIIGRVSNDLHTGEVIWDFFSSSHP